MFLNVYELAKWFTVINSIKGGRVEPPAGYRPAVREEEQY